MSHQCNSVRRCLEVTKEQSCIHVFFEDMQKIRLDQKKELDISKNLGTSVWKSEEWQVLV